MKRTHRLVLLSLIAVLLVFVASPALATEGTTEGETTETTVASEQIFEGEGPAVEAPADEVEVTEQPWTVRFLYPAILAATVLLIVGIAIGYNRNIRKRYQVVS
jgi:membrane protein implicated in regulation of membrane protease activity